MWTPLHRVTVVDARFRSLHPILLLFCLYASFFFFFKYVKNKQIYKQTLTTWFTSNHFSFLSCGCSFFFCYVSQTSELDFIQIPPTQLVGKNEVQRNNTVRTNLLLLLLKERKAPGLGEWKGENPTDRGIASGCFCGPLFSNEPSDSDRWPLSKKSTTNSGHKTTTTTTTRGKGQRKTDKEKKEKMPVVTISGVVR